MTGVLQDATFMDAAAATQNMLYARPLINAGDKCVCVDDGLPTWIGEMMLAHAPVDEAIEIIKAIEADIESCIQITPA